MEVKARERVTLKSLGNDAASYLAHEGGIYNESTEEEVYVEVSSEITYSDLEKGYQDITKVFERIEDGKFFKWSYMYSPHVSTDESCDKELVEVFPYTHEVTGYL